MVAYGALQASGDRNSQQKGGNLSWRWMAGIAACSAVIVLAALVVSGTGSGPSVLLSSGQIAPGTQLELQTSSGPMLLTVDSAMNSAGYVHATGLLLPSHTCLFFPVQHETIFLSKGTAYFGTLKIFLWSGSASQPADKVS